MGNQRVCLIHGCGGLGARGHKRRGSEAKDTSTQPTPADSDDRPSKRTKASAAAGGDHAVPWPALGLA